MKPLIKSVKTGECDACPRSNVELWPVQGSTMMLCEKCYDAETDVIEELKSTSKLVDTSRKIDQSIKLDVDIFNAATVPFVELKAAIDNDETIPADQKDYEFARECEARIKVMNAAIFEEEAALTKKRNERASWVIQTQEFIGKLRADQREKFKKFDISYTPAPITKRERTTKPTKSVSSGKQKFNLAEAKRMAEKYGVPAAGIQSLVISRNMSYDDAAKQLASLMGLPLPS